MRLKRALIGDLTVVGMLGGLGAVVMFGGMMVGGIAQAQASTTTTGNGAPSGAHYDLNIIGVPHGKTASMTNSDGHTIFVNLGSKTTGVTSKINLSQSTDGSFAVLDANGTDADGAAFALPAPGTYTIWSRALGKPGGSATVTTCATDPTTGGVICSTTNSVFVRGTGQSKFTNVTTQLTTITLSSTTGTTCTSTTVSLFDPCLQGYFWSYDNNGLKILQVRFYQNA